jgi:tetratricopeptide (TPR) repeat protein
MDASGHVATGPRYRAFISYSHRDERSAKALHRAIEGYRVPRPLIGRPGRDGPVPDKLFPIFRDRDELTPSADLPASIREALGRSACLVVLCSPASAASRWVDQEIRLFRGLGRADRIFPVIIEGEPNAADPAAECFPPALRSSEAADAIETVEPLAADLRPHADGREDGTLKLIAALLGIPFNDLKRREVAVARRRARIYQGVAAAMVLLAALAVGGGWLALRYARHAQGLLAEGIRISADQVTAAVRFADQEGVPRKLIEGLLGGAEDAFEGLYRATAEAPRLPWRPERVPTGLAGRRALLLLVFADHYGVLGQTERQRQTAEKARAALEEVVARDPAEPEWRRQLARAHDVVGNAIARQWLVADALAHYRAALAIREELARQAPDDDGRRRDVALSLLVVGDMLRRQSQWQQAIDAYRQAEAIGERLAAADPDDRQRQRDLVVTRHRIGDMHLRQGSPQLAEAVYRESLTIAERLAAAEPTNVQAGRDLSISQEKLGTALRRQGRRDEALAVYRASLAVIAPLAADDPANFGLQRDLSKSHEAIGDALAETGEPVTAEAAYGQALAIAEALAGADPTDILLQREVTVIWNKLGDVLDAQGRADEALALYRRALAERERLAGLDPTNAQAGRDLAMSHDRIGGLLETQGLLADALAAYQAALEIFRRFAAANPGDGGWQQDVGLSQRKIARVTSALASAKPEVKLETGAGPD